MGWVVHVARRAERKDACRVWQENQRERENLESLKYMFVGYEFP